MADDASRECLSVGQLGEDRTAALVVSTDPDRQNFLSEIYDFPDPSSQGSKVFSRDIWISSMWVSPTGTHFLCEILGRCFHDLTGSFVEAKVSPTRLFKIWGLSDDAVWTVGAEGRCFRFDRSGWSDFSAGLSGYVHAIGGVAENALFAAGDGGFVARSTGGAWQPLQLPTNADIRGILALGPDKAYLCGHRGACFLLDGDVLTPITAPDNVNFYSIAQFGGATYFGSLEGGIYVLSGTSLSPFKPQARGYAMATGPRQLVTCGLNQMARFDGTAWKARTFS